MNTNDRIKIPIDEINADIDAIFWSMRLCHVRRFFHQRFWEKETTEAEYASLIEPFPRLESVAEHSWLVADSCIILCPHFYEINQSHCIELSILHDKLENITGDKSPIGRDGTGSKTHAFSDEYRIKKNDLEIDALNQYLSTLRPSIRKRQEELIFEIIEGKTQESLFVKAVDKLLALAFVYKKKKGELGDKHLKFTFQYSKKVYESFPGLYGHHHVLMSRLLESIAKNRSITVDELNNKINNLISETEQYKLFQ